MELIVHNATLSAQLVQLQPPIARSALLLLTCLAAHAILFVLILTMGITMVELGRLFA